MFDASKGPGRVFFFPEETLQPDWVAYQPLLNHVENVRHLLKHWRIDIESFDLAIPEQQRKELFEGAAYHDWGKTSKFSIRKTKSNKKEHWTYSYSGHRFLHPSDIDEEAKTNKSVLYHRALENAHHDYSVEEIVNDAYNLKQQEASYKDYPRDLFVLEMCDQIEAEVAVMAIQGKEGRNSSFMEFEVTLNKEQSSEDEKVFELDPFPFEQSVQYTVQFRKDDTSKQSLSASMLREKGFATYDPLETIKVTLQGAENTDESRYGDARNFYEVAANFEPNALQNEVWEAWGKKPGLIVKAPTGVGKTEACVYPPLARKQRVVLVLPAKALVDDHKKRFQRVLTKLSQTDKQKRRLLIDTGDSAELYTYQQEELDVKPNTDKRHLYRADVIITTLDKFLYRFFGYGGGKKSYTYPLRINDKKRMAFIFDEAHSYEGTAFTNFQQLVTTLYDNEHNIVLMTATLPENYQKILQDPEDFGFAGRWDVIDFLAEDKQRELLQGKGKFYGKRKLNYIPDETVPQKADPDDSESFAAAKESFDKHKQNRVSKILEQIQHNWTGKERLIVTLDRVQDATEVYLHLRESQSGFVSLYPDELKEQANLFLYHGRLDRKWRSQVYDALKWRDDKEQPYILVSTSAIEIGVDLDAQILVTEMCNPDSLIQRIGRCNRKGKEENARVIVVGSHIPDYLNDFANNEAAYKNYLGLLTKWNGSTIDRTFASEVLDPDVFPKPVLTDPRASTAYDMLYKYVYDFELEYKNLHDLGFIATRSWEPALEVLIPARYNDKNEPIFDFIQVPVGRMSLPLVGSKEVREEILGQIQEMCKSALIEQYTFQQDQDKSWTGEWKPVHRWGDLYKSSYRIKLLPESPTVINYERELGLVDIPRLFGKRRGWNHEPPLKTTLITYVFERDDIDNKGTLFVADKKGKYIELSYLADPILDVA